MRDKTWLFVAATLALLTSGCGREHTPPTYQTLDDFSSLHLSARSLVTSATLPTAPRGFTDADVRALAGAITEMSTRGTYNRDVWHPPSQREATRLVLLGLDRETSQWIGDSARHDLKGRPWANLVGTVFAKDVQVTGAPTMQRAIWHVRRENHDGPQLTVNLQTQTFYAVRQGGRDAVIAVTRTIGMSSPNPTDADYSSFMFEVHAPGAEPCDFVLHSVITPEPDPKKYRAAMSALVKRPDTGFVEPTDDDSAATAKACLRAHPHG